MCNVWAKVCSYIYLVFFPQNRPSYQQYYACMYNYTLHNNLHPHNHVLYLMKKYTKFIKILKYTCHLSVCSQYSMFHQHSILHTIYKTYIFLEV